MVAAIFVAVAAPAQSSPPPLPLAVFAATGAQSVAGQSFAGLAIIPRSEYIFSVSCDAQLGRKSCTLASCARKTGGAKPAAVTCSWRIPAGAHGKTLRISKESVNFTTGDEASGPTFVWTVKK
jgi:hypothetical protein